jgi:hypothetical protein
MIWSLMPRSIRVVLRIFGVASVLEEVLVVEASPERGLIFLETDPKA